MGRDTSPTRVVEHGLVLLIIGTGGLVISLDFELGWGVLDTPGTEGPYRSNLLGAREVIPRILELFDRFDVAATWATVGFLFAESREEVDAYAPRLRPLYRKRTLDPYREAVGRDEKDDPIHLAPSLIRMIAGTPRQRIGTHTFSHYYCLEAGQDAAMFDADIAAAIAIARAKSIELRSIVFPRHQVRPDYFPILRKHGIVAFRGNEPHWLDRPVPAPGGSLFVRAVRRADSYVSITGFNTLMPSSVSLEHGLVNVHSSRFLRPVERRFAALEPLRMRRVVAALDHAATQSELLHIWWHPHNMGLEQDENLASLSAILERFDRLRSETGIQSYSMEDVADMATSSKALSLG